MNSTTFLIGDVVDSSALVPPIRAKPPSLSESARRVTDLICTSSSPQPEDLEGSFQDMCIRQQVFAC